MDFLSTIKNTKKTIKNTIKTIRLNIVPGGELLPKDLQSGKFLQDEEGYAIFNNSPNKYRLVDYYWEGPSYHTVTKEKVKGRKRSMLGAMTGGAIGGAAFGGLGAIGGAIAGHNASGGARVVTKSKDVESPTGAELHVMDMDDNLYIIRFTCTTSLDKKIRQLTFFK